MSLYKREGSTIWWTQFRFNGKRIQKSTGTDDRGRAEEFEARLKAGLYDQERLGVKPEYSWEDAVVKFVTETKHKTSHQTDLYHLRWLDQHLSGKHLSQIDKPLLETIIQKKLAEGVKPRTVNAVTNIIRQVLRKAQLDWEWLDRIPKFRMLQEPKNRIRFITREEADRLISELPPHLKRMAIFALETGLRRANVTGLQWSQVDLERRIAWIHPDQAKARKAITVPLSLVAVDAIKECEGENEEFVFTYKGNKVYQTGSTAWEKACTRAGIENFRWHDLRHTWASWHVQDGTPLSVLQELGSWESPEMVQKYAHLSADHLAKYARRNDPVDPVDNSDVVTESTTPQKRTA